MFYRGVLTPAVGVRVPAAGPARQERQFAAASGVRAGHQRRGALPNLPVPLPRRHPGSCSVLVRQSVRFFFIFGMYSSLLIQG